MTSAATLDCTKSAIVQLEVDKVWRRENPPTVVSVAVQQTPKTFPHIQITIFIKSKEVGLLHDLTR